MQTPAARGAKFMFIAAVHFFDRMVILRAINVAAEVTFRHIVFLELEPYTAAAFLFIAHSGLLGMRRGIY